MARLLTLSVLVICTVLAITTADDPDRFNLMTEEPPRFRFQPFVSASGNIPQNFHAGVGGYAEYDIHRFKHGGRVVGSVAASQGFGLFDGQPYLGEPQGGVGVRLEVPFG